MSDYKKKKNVIKKQTMYSLKWENIIYKYKTFGVLKRNFAGQEFCTVHKENNV